MAIKAAASGPCPIHGPKAELPLRGRKDSPNHGALNQSSMATLRFFERSVRAASTFPKGVKDSAVRARFVEGPGEATTIAPSVSAGWLEGSCRS